LSIGFDSNISNIHTVAGVFNGRYLGTKGDAKRFTALISCSDGTKDILNVVDCATDGDLTTTRHELVQHLRIHRSIPNDIHSDSLSSECLQLSSRNTGTAIREKQNPAFISGWISFNNLQSDLQSRRKIRPFAGKTFSFTDIPISLFVKDSC
jgi:hypothetical protein